MSNYKFKSKKLYETLISEYVPPRIMVKPRLEDYNLSEGLIQEYQKEKANNEKKEEKQIYKLLIIGFIIGSVLCVFISLEDGDVVFFLINLVQFLFIGVFLAFVGGLIISKIMNKYPSVKKKRFIKIEKAVNEYEHDIVSYQYWTRRKKKEYWLKLSGREFENELSVLYKKQGYSAVVSSQGGDQGIDIVLLKNNKKTIVQCKAHNKPVGPAVARDFYGTMIHHRVKSGIIASTTGFTKGVYEFIKGKDIKLITVNEIIELENKLED